MRRHLIPITMLGAVITVAPAAHAAITSQAVRASVANENYPALAVDAGGERTLMWAGSRPGDRDLYDAYLAHDGAPKTKLNARGQAWPGGIDLASGVAVFQQAYRGDSSILFYDVATGRRTGAGDRVNTDRQWEYAPSISGRWLVFGRVDTQARPQVRRLLIQDRLAGTRARVLASFAGSNSAGTLTSFDVNGDWVVWTRCSDGYRVCQVYRERISTGYTVRVPRPDGRLNYASSVGDDGTVYFARSRVGCGRGVTIRSYALDGTEALLTPLPAGTDSWATDAATRPDGGTDVVYDLAPCTTAGNWNVYQLTTPPPTG